MMLEKRATLVRILVAALVIVNVTGFFVAYAEGHLTAIMPAASVTANVTTTTEAIFKSKADASCGTLLKAGTSWPPAGQDAWLYLCSSTADVWPYSVVDAGQYTLGRSLISFDTSSIPASATVVSATLRLAPRLIVLTHPGGTTLEVVPASQGPTLEASDYDKVGSTALARRSLSALQTGQLNLLPLNATGVEAINKGGVTQFGLRLGLDLNNQAPLPASDATVGMAQAILPVAGLELTVIYNDPSGHPNGPQVTGIEPDLVTTTALNPPSSPPRVSVRGNNFSSGAAFRLLAIGSSHALDVDAMGPILAIGQLPAGLPVGVYDVLITNSDGTWATLPGGFTVSSGVVSATHRSYFPLMRVRTTGVW